MWLFIRYSIGSFPTSSHLGVKMNRILLVYNPCSSRFADVKREVLPRVRTLKGYIIGKYEIKPTDINQNIANLAKIIQDGDLIISAGGDATGVIAVNAIMKSTKRATLAALPYGNFNDLARTLRTKNINDVFKNCKLKQQSLATSNNCLYPLDIIVDGKHWRYATCYVTIGMTAEAVKLYDTQKMRRKLKTSFGRNITSYTAIAGWYFRNRRKHVFIPEFKLNGIKQHPNTSDYAAVNGRFMARIMRGGDDYTKPKVFRHETDRLATSFIRLAILMIKSVFRRVPGTETTGDIIEFSSPATFTLQAEGESERFENVHQIEIRKASTCLKVIQN